MPSSRGITASSRRSAQRHLRTTQPLHSTPPEGNAVKHFLAVGREPNATYFGTEGGSGTARAVRFNRERPEGSRPAANKKHPGWRQSQPPTLQSESKWQRGQTALSWDAVRKSRSEHPPQRRAEKMASIFSNRFPIISALHRANAESSAMCE